MIGFEQIGYYEGLTVMVEPDYGDPDSRKESLPSGRGEYAGGMGSADCHPE